MIWPATAKPWNDDWWASLCLDRTQAIQHWLKHNHSLFLIPSLSMVSCQLFYVGKPRLPFKKLWLCLPYPLPIPFSSSPTIALSLSLPPSQSQVLSVSLSRSYLPFYKMFTVFSSFSHFLSSYLFFQQIPLPFKANGIRRKTLNCQDASSTWIIQRNLAAVWKSFTTS